MRYEFSDEPWTDVKAAIRSIKLTMYPFMLGYSGETFVLMGDSDFIDAMAEGEPFERVERVNHPFDLLIRMYPWWHEGEEYPS